MEMGEILMKVALERTPESLEEALMIIDRLRYELKKRPRCFSVTTEQIGSNQFVFSDPLRVPVIEHDGICRLVPEYHTVEIEYEDYVYKFLSPVFTRTKNEKQEAQAYAMIDGTVRIEPDPSTYTKTTKPSDACSHVYSRSMDQPYPRLCVICGEPLGWKRIRSELE